MALSHQTYPRCESVTINIFDKIILLGSILAPLAIVLSLPPFYIGIWVQVSLPTSFLHIISGIILIGLGCLNYLNVESARAAITHPMVKIPIVLSLLSTIFLPFSIIPDQSILGTPEHGYGILTFFDIAILTAAYLYLFRKRNIKILFFFLALILIFSINLLNNAFAQKETWAPFFFNDYLVYYAIFGLVVTLTTIPNRFLEIFAVSLIFAVLLVISENKAGFLSAFVSLMICLCFWIFNIDKRQILFFSCLVLPFITTFAILFLGSSFEENLREPIRNVFGSNTLGDFIFTSWASLWSRSMLGWVVLWDIFDNPWILLRGIGWGQFNEALIQHLTMVKGRIFELIGESRVYWDAIRRNDFHSHNQFLEAMLAVGLPGLFIWTSYFAAIPYYANASHVQVALYLALFLGVLNSFWFQMPQSTPLMAMAIAACSRINIGGSPSKWWPELASPISIILALTLIASGLWGLNRSLLAGAKNKQIIHFSTEKKHNSDIEFAISDVRISNQIVLLQKLFSKLDAKPNIDYNTKRNSNFPAPEDFILNSQGSGSEPRKINNSNVIALSQVLNSYTATQLKSSPGAFLATLNNIISGLYFQYPKLRVKFEPIISLWSTAATSLITKLPRRSDLLVPYFSFLLEKKNETKLIIITKKLLENNLNDPVALWFSGIANLNLPNKKELGYLQMKQSLRFGIQNFMPISKTLINTLNETE